MINLNPFKPGSPVPPGTFAGRARELTQVQKAIFQTSYQSPQNVLITGERGIGKTSIAHIVKASAESQGTASAIGTSLRAIGVDSASPKRAEATVRNES